MGRFSSIPKGDQELNYHELEEELDLNWLRSDEFRGLMRYATQVSRLLKTIAKCHSEDPQAVPQ